jgi:hypothetical protein
MAKSLTTLKRFGHKGQFVKYPSKWRPQMRHTGKRRFDTYCDLIVGVCACGERHSETDDWVEDMLRREHCEIETHADWLARTRKEAAVAAA